MRKCLAIALILIAHTAWAASAIPVTITTAHGPKPLQLEVAATPETREYGLMNRTGLAPGGGMLFLFPHTEPVGFWMKDTKIPLDMLFIDAQGTIVRIAADTVPESLTPIDSGKPIKAVIEIAGGRAKQYAIHEGDHVTYTLPAGMHVQ